MEALLEYFNSLPDDKTVLMNAVPILNKFTSNIRRIKTLKITIFIPLVRFVNPNDGLALLTGAICPLLVDKRIRHSLLEYYFHTNAQKTFSSISISLLDLIYFLIFN